MKPGTLQGEKHAERHRDRQGRHDRVQRQEVGQGESRVRREGRLRREGTGRRIQGIGQIIEAWQGWGKAIPDSKATFVAEHASGDTAVLEVVWKGVHTGPLQTQLRRRANELGVADRVIWEGYVSPEQLVGAYHAATAFWFPSNARSEGFGLVQVEAMASGRPIVATRSGGPQEAVVEGQSGILVPIEDPPSLAAALIQVLTDASLATRLGAAARQHVVDNFSLEATVCKYEALYRRFADIA